MFLNVPKLLHEKTDSDHEEMAGLAQGLSQIVATGSSFSYQLMNLKQGVECLFCVKSCS